MTFRELRQYVGEDFRLYYKAGKAWWSPIGATVTVLLEPGFSTMFHYRWAHYFFTKRIRLLALLIMRWNKLWNHVDISYEASIGSRLRLPHCFDVVVGATAVIGNDVEILNGVTLGAVELRSGEKRHPTIEDNVLIGSGAKVLGNITIGAGAKVGANSVVLKDVAPGQTVAGIPAAPINVKDV